MNTNESSWKPSEGQLECLEYAINNAKKDYSPLAGNRIYLTLKALKKQLEKIKNENIAMEDYKKKYEDALERAREMCAMPIDKATMEYVFPELKESEDEDERIRKELIDAIHGLWDNDALPIPLSVKRKDEWISWLEKQGTPAKSKYIEKQSKKPQRMVSAEAKEALYGMKTPLDKAVEEEANAWLEKQGKCETDCPQNHQDVNHPNGCITMEDFSGGEGFYKLNIEYLNKKQVEEIEEIIRTWNKDADCELCTSKDYCISIEKPITIGKCKLTGKAAELAKEVTPESLEEAKEKLNAEEKLNQRLNQEIQGWWENSEHMDSLWCTVKDAIELTARHFFELGLEHKQKVCTEKDIKMIDILCCIFEVSNGYYKVDKPGQYAIRAEEILDWLKSFKRKLS